MSRGKEVAADKPIERPGRAVTLFDLSLVHSFSGEPGTTSITEFLDSIDTASELGGWTDDQKKAVLSVRLVAPALHYHNYERPSKDATWTQVKQQYLKWFYEAPSYYDVIGDFLGCKQRPRETAKNFAVRLKLAGIAAVAAAKTDGIEESCQAMVDSSTLPIFMKGLRIELRSAYVTSQTTLDSAVAHATNYEEIFSIERPAAVSAAVASLTPSELDSQIANLVNALTELLRSRNEATSREQSPRQVSKQSPSTRSPSPSRSVEDFPEVLCYRCGILGHYANQCLSPPNPLRQRMICKFCGRNGHSKQECRHYRSWLAVEVS